MEIILTPIYFIVGTLLLKNGRFFGGKYLGLLLRENLTTFNLESNQYY
ncbi:MAG: hypothetical protein HYS25_05990 [Ignavibacteriales bacterium]|nr:hypothetical protein [Ignavibacteriales bacterium]